MAIDSKIWTPPPQQCADLQTVNFSLLLNQDEKEQAKLLKVSKDIGFFYLDMSDVGSEGLLKIVDNLRRLMGDWFELGLDEKMKASSGSNSHGYKPMGTHSGVGNAKDGYECLKIGQQEMRARWALPQVIKENLSEFDDFMVGSQFVLKTLLARLSASLGLFSHESLQSYHHDDMPSKTTAVFNHYPPRDDKGSNMGQNMHTDLGTLTLLFTEQWGLQVLCPKLDPADETMEWLYVEPRPGHAVINVGDTLRFLTGQNLRSSLHRALPVHHEDRFSIAYLMRADDTVVFKDSNGKTVRAVEWFGKKFQTFEAPQEMQNKDNVLLGGLVNGFDVNTKVY